MTEHFVEMGLSNAFFALALAILAMAVGSVSKRPHLAHMLWLLVFVKLITPPIVSIPVNALSVSAQTASATQTVEWEDHASHAGTLVEGVRKTAGATPGKPPQSAEIAEVSFQAALQHTKRWLPPVWFFGSVIVLAWSLVRVFRFGRLLAAESQSAPEAVQAAAVKISRRLGLSMLPTIRTTSAHISPLVWWTGGRVQVVIPTTLLDEMDEENWQWVLAHELAHVRRRDYLVRWLEWLACVAFWWNPVVWWAQRNLRAAEEICCDALVLSSLNPKPHTYANSLLSAVELLSHPAFRPPAMASEINSGGFLERRFSMIVSGNENRATSRWLQVCTLLCAIVVLPLGLASAQDHDAIGKRLKKAVKKGEITEKQAHAMLGALKKSGKGDHTHKKSDLAKKGHDEKLHEHHGEHKLHEHKLHEHKHGAHEHGAHEHGAHEHEHEHEHDAHEHHKKVDVAAIGKEIRAAVEAGKLTKEQGRAKMAVVRKAASLQHGDLKKVDLKAISQKIKAAIAAGKITEEEGRVLMAAIRKNSEAKRDHKNDKPNWDAIKKLIEGAVKSGLMTREQANEAHEGVRKQMAFEHESASRTISDDEFERASIEIRKAIAAGKVSKEHGQIRLGEIRKMMAKQAERAAKKAARPNWGARKQRIEDAVKAGKMTRKEANAKHEALRREWAEKGERSKQGAERDGDGE